MLIGQLSTGEYLVGIEEGNVEHLRNGNPMVIDLRKTGGKDCLLVFYAPTMAALLEQVERLSAGPLPQPQALPEGTIDPDHHNVGLGPDPVKH